jgi:hypothetical protein
MLRNVAFLALATGNQQPQERGAARCAVTLVSLLLFVFRADHPNQQQPPEEEKPEDKKQEVKKRGGFLGRSKDEAKPKEEGGAEVHNPVALSFFAQRFISHCRMRTRQMTRSKTLRSVLGFWGVARTKTSPKKKAARRYILTSLVASLTLSW